MVRVEKGSEWVLPANMKQAAKDATGVYAAHQAYASGEDPSQIEPHAIVDLDYARIKKVMARPLIVDGRNLLDPGLVRALGFTYSGIGRP